MKKNVSLNILTFLFSFTKRAALWFVVVQVTVVTFLL